MSDTPARLRLVRRTVEALAIAWALLLLVTFAWRVGFPLELEWMEGGMLHHALRFQTGSGIYKAPSIEFIPYLYTPLYPAILATVGELFGLTSLIVQCQAEICPRLQMFGGNRQRGTEMRLRDRRLPELE